MTLNVAGCSLPYWNTVGWAQRRRTAGTKGSCFQCSKDGDRFFENYAETCERNAENVKKRYTTATDVYDGNDRKAVCSPDFSTYTDMPLAMQIYNHYRKHWVAAYWQLHGLTVYPTVGWSDESSYAWCFDGEPVGGVVAVSSVGTQQNNESKRLFLRGYEEMMKRLEPKWIIFYGNVPEECDWNVIRVKPHYDEIVKRRERKWADAVQAAGQA